MTARIYKPAKTAMQSGQAKTHDWVLDYEPEERFIALLKQRVTVRPATPASEPQAAAMQPA